MANIDPSNNPSLVIVNGITLPPDVIINFDSDKLIVESRILDGVAVFERISRSPHQITFDMFARQLGENVPIGQDLYVFPQDIMEQLFNSVFLPDQVITVQNTMLNGLGITELVVKHLSYYTIRGSKNVGVRIDCLENYTPNDTQGQTLIVS